MTVMTVLRKLKLFCCRVKRFCLIDFWFWIVLQTYWKTSSSGKAFDLIRVVLGAYFHRELDFIDWDTLGFVHCFKTDAEEILETKPWNLPSAPLPINNSLAFSLGMWHSFVFSMLNQKKTIKQSNTDLLVNNLVYIQSSNVFRLWKQAISG
jgi:hypothetical protein